MDKELEQWYEDQFTMFSTTGWKSLMEQVKEMVTTYNDLRRIPDQDKFQFTKGQLDILDWLSGWAEKVETSYKDLKDASKDL